MSAKEEYSRVVRAKTVTVGAQSARALLQHEVVGKLADGRLPLALADADLKVSITLDTSVTDPTSRTAYKLIVDGGPPIDASERVLLPTEFVPGTKVDALLPLSYMVTEGDFLLDYATYTTLGENEEIAHLPIRVIVDRSSPGGAHLGPLTFSTVPDDLLTEADLVGGKLPGTVNDWFGMAAQDTATAWIAPGRTPAPGDWIELPLVKHDVVVPGEEVTFSFDKTDLTAFSDGYQSFSYKLRDVLGNPETDLATPKVLRVLLSDSPEDILPPVVPAFEDHGLITWDDARPGLRVQIPVYTNPDPTDAFVIKWGNYSAPASPPLGTLPAPLPTPPDPIATVVLDLDFVQQMPNGTVNVSYEILRGGVLVGFSTDTTVEMDLRTPGAIVDPDPLTPVHDNLQDLTVKSSSGAVNTIPPQDYNNDGTITIARLGKDGAVVWQNGDLVEVTWGALKFPSPPFEIQNQIADLVLPLSSVDVIQPGPNGPVDVSYTLSRPLTVSPNLGVARSAITKVNVVAAGEVPGGGLPLGDPRFTEANANNIINQTAARGGTPIRIMLPITNMDIDDNLSIEFTGRFGTVDGSGAPIPGTEVNDNHSLVQADLTRGYYEFIIPESILQRICENVGTVKYVASNSVAPIDSATVFVKIFVRTPGYCTVPTP